MNEDYCEKISEEPAIISRLSLLSKKVIQLGDKLSPMSMSIPKESMSDSSSNKSQVMSIIDKILRDVDDITGSLDI